MVKEYKITFLTSLVFTFIESFYFSFDSVGMKMIHLLKREYFQKTVQYLQLLFDRNH